MAHHAGTHCSSAEPRASPAVAQRGEPAHHPPPYQTLWTGGNRGVSALMSGGRGGDQGGVHQLVRKSPQSPRMGLTSAGRDRNGRFDTASKEDIQWKVVSIDRGPVFDATWMWASSVLVLDRCREPRLHLCCKRQVISR